jgi:hypothetical protein
MQNYLSTELKTVQYPFIYFVEGYPKLKQELLELDQEFKDNHIEILKRFYGLFESIYKYVKGMNTININIIINQLFCRFDSILGGFRKWNLYSTYFGGEHGENILIITSLGDTVKRGCKAISR